MAHIVALTFIRHGATINNERHVYQGWLDTPLLPSEIERLCRLRSSYPKPDFVLSSDLTRCLETAHALFPHHPIEAIEHLRELHFGEFEGKSYAQLKHDRAYQNWLRDPYVHSPTRGESWATFTERLQKGWNQLQTTLTEQTQEVVIVTHGGVIRYYLEKYAPFKQAFWEWTVPLGGGYRLLTTQERVRRNERCISLSEVPLMEKQNG